MTTDAIPPPPSSDPAQDGQAWARLAYPAGLRQCPKITDAFTAACEAAMQELASEKRQAPMFASASPEPDARSRFEAHKGRRDLRRVQMAALDSECEGDCRGGPSDAAFIVEDEPVRRAAAPRYGQDDLVSDEPGPGSDGWD